MPNMFGTDGVRGLANRDLTAQLALDLGDAAVRVLGIATEGISRKAVAVRWSAGIPVFPVISSHPHCPRA